MENYVLYIKSAADSIDVLRKCDVFRVIDELRSAEVNFKSYLPKVEVSQYSGMIVVVTGSIPGFTREQVEEWFRIKGASVTSSVSKKTNLVVYGEAAGSKLAKANELNIRTLSAEEWLKEV